MDEWLTKEEINAKYRHVSQHQLPFETEIIEIIPQKGINFSDRWKFLKGLFFVVKEGYFFQYTDVCHGIIDFDQDGQPFDIFLDGAIRCAYSYAFTSSVESTIAFLMGILSEGKLFIGIDKYNKPYYYYVGFSYTYLREQHVGNENKKEEKEIKCEEIIISGKKYPDDYLQSSRIKRMFGKPIKIGPYSKLDFYDRIACSIGFDGKTLRFPGKYLQIVAYNNDFCSLLDNNTLKVENNVLFNNYRFLGNTKNLIWLKINSFWGLYNRTLLKFTIPPICSDFGYSPLGSDCVIVKIEGKYGLAREDGTILLDSGYDKIENISSLHYKVKQGIKEWEIKLKEA